MGILTGPDLHFFFLSKYTLYYSVVKDIHETISFSVEVLPLGNFQFTSFP